MLIYSFISVAVVSIVSLIGSFTLSLKEPVLRKYTFILISLAVGALLGDAFIHLIPEAFESASNPILVSCAVVAGILIFFILEKFLHWHHHQSEETECVIHPTGKMILLSDGVHNFIDGLIIGASYLISIEIGIATTIAVVLHEIPQEIADFGILIHSGYTKAKALWFNFLSALTAFAGLIVALVVGGAIDSVTIWLMPIAAGGFIYIAMSDLIPELHKTKIPHRSVIQFIAVCVGIGVMLLLLAIE